MFACLTPPASLTLVIPCHYEERSLERYVEPVQAIADDQLTPELIIVEGASGIALMLNVAARSFLVFPGSRPEVWR